MNINFDVNSALATLDFSRNLELTLCEIAIHRFSVMS